MLLFSYASISTFAIRYSVGRKSIKSRHLAGGEVSQMIWIEPIIVGMILYGYRTKRMNK